MDCFYCVFYPTVPNFLVLENGEKYESCLILNLNAVSLRLVLAVRYGLISFGRDLLR